MKSPLARAVSGAVALTLAASLAAGCGREDNMTSGGAEPEVREVEDVRAEVKTISSDLLDLTGLRGKVSEPGPGVVTCTDRERGEYFFVRHTWSVKEVPESELERAMAELRDGLSDRGWEVAKYGPNNSPAGTIELLAGLEPEQYTAEISFLDGRNLDPEADLSTESMLYVMVRSACYRVPEGQTVTQY